MNILSHLIKTYFLISFCLIFACSNKNPAEATGDTATAIKLDNIQHTFGSTKPIPASKHDLDSILASLAEEASYIFIDLYPIVDSLPSLENDSFMLADKLDSLGYIYLTGSSGNYMYGPRFRHRVYKKNGLVCNTYKAYQYHEEKEDGTYTMLIYEQLECIFE